MSEDLTNDEYTKMMDDAEKEYNTYLMCEGVSYWDNRKQFSVEHVGGRILLVCPDKHEIDKNTLCKLLEMKGMNYVQAHVTKRENFSTIEDEKNTPLFTLREIIDKHTPIWLDMYENDRKGSRISIGNKIFTNYNRGYDKINDLDVIFDEDLSTSSNEHTAFFDDNSSEGKGKRIVKDKNKEITTLETISSQSKNTKEVVEETKEVTAYDLKIKLFRNDYSQNNKQCVLLDTTTHTGTQTFILKMENIDEVLINTDQSYVNPLNANEINKLKNLQVGTLFIIQNSMFIATTGQPL